MLNVDLFFRRRPSTYSRAARRFRVEKRIDGGWVTVVTAPRAESDP